MLINNGVVLMSIRRRYTSGAIAITAWAHRALLNNTCMVGLW